MSTTRSTRGETGERGTSRPFRRAPVCATKAGMENARVMEGKYAVVTGSTRGIGRAVAGVLARHGCNVVISSRSPVDCAQTAGEIAAEHGVRAAGMACDVSVQS